MAKQRVLHPEWRDSHATTPYPFMDDALLRNDTGTFLPEGTFLDATLYPIGGQVGLRLSKVVITSDVVQIYIGDAANDELASGSFSMLEPPEELRLVDTYGRPAGLLVSESLRLAIFQAWGPGTHLFSQTQAGFVSDVCHPTPEIALRGFILDDGSVFADDIWLVGADGVVLSVEQNSPVQNGCLTQSLGDETVIRVDVVGDPLFRRRLCEGVFTTPTFLRTLTVKRGCREIVCGPDEFGDFKLTVGHQDAADTVLRVRTTAEGLTVEAVGEHLEDIQ